MEKIGIYGGAFNPPHIGHIHAARYAVQTLRLDKLLLIPSCVSPHKQLPQNSPDARQRLEMLKIATQEDSAIEVSDLELRRGGVSYTYETVDRIAKQYPDAEGILFMGTDMFLSFMTWREPERILQKVSIAVFYRGDANEMEAVAAQKKALEAFGAKIYLVENPVNELSSTDLRRMLIFRCADSVLPFGVGEYIRDNGLYGTDREYRGLSLEELEQVVVGLMKPNRVAHILGCRDTAMQLAEIWGADKTAAARAGLLHDITKALDGPHQLTLCREYGIILDNFSRENPKTLHALTGSLVADRVFGETKAVVDAIRGHTTGKANMNTLEKIIYVADYMEPNRDFPEVEQLRSLAFTDLDKALELGLTMTLDMLKRQGREISPASLEALAYLNRQQ